MDRRIQWLVLVQADLGDRGCALPGGDTSSARNEGCEGFRQDEELESQVICLDSCLDTIALTCLPEMTAAAPLERSLLIKEVSDQS